MASSSESVTDSMPPTRSASVGLIIRFSRVLPWAVPIKGKMPFPLRRGLLFQDEKRLKQVAAYEELENPALLKELRRDVARMKTIQHERELQAAGASARASTAVVTISAGPAICAAPSMKVRLVSVRPVKL